MHITSPRMHIISPIYSAPDSVANCKLYKAVLRIIKSSPHNAAQVNTKLKNAENIRYKMILLYKA